MATGICRILFTALLRDPTYCLLYSFIMSDADIVAAVTGLALARVAQQDETAPTLTLARAYLAAGQPHQALMHALPLKRRLNTEEFIQLVQEAGEGVALLKEKQHEKDLKQQQESQRLYRVKRNGELAIGLK